MTDLITRLSEGEGADRELDIAIAKAISDCPLDRYWKFEWLPLGARDWSTVPEYTASLDSCITLAEKVMPKHWAWQILTVEERTIFHAVFLNTTMDYTKETSHKSLCRAFLIALIIAKEASHE